MRTNLKTGDFRVTERPDGCCECGRESRVLLVEIREDGDGDYEHSVCAECIIANATVAKRLLQAIENV